MPPPSHRRRPPSARMNHCACRRHTAPLPPTMPHYLSPHLGSPDLVSVNSMATQVSHFRRRSFSDAPFTLSSYKAVERDAVLGYLGASLGGAAGAINNLVGVGEQDVRLELHLLCEHLELQVCNRYSGAIQGTRTSRGPSS